MPSNREPGSWRELAHLVADSIVNAHLATMLRLNIEYDVLPRESEILHLQFWAAAFELLKERKAIYFETDGKNSGCWVMPSSAFRGDDEANEDSKVIVRSNGTVTYVGQRHRLSTLEVRSARQRLLLPPAHALHRRP